jgi:beta-phosphoglucomutase-like phosphatase (HAD superfamily)
MGRLAEEALEAGWLVAVASTSTEDSVRAVVEHTLGPDTAGRLSAVLAGDIVANKKPAPDIYQLALRRLNVDAADAVAIEDSRNGLLSAIGAGLSCIVNRDGLHGT